MDAHSGRRAFFTDCIRLAGDLVARVSGSESRRRDLPGDIRPDFSPDVVSDLSPELLAAEARRLGLDPETDRDLIYDILDKEMRAQAGKIHREKSG